jgi:DNA-binding transcriptional ArsR family regulator
MIGIFSRTTELYNALANETRMSILILLEAKKEMDLKDFRDYLEEKSIEILENHLSILEKVELIQKRDPTYSLTKEGKRRLSELGVTESEAIELTKEREISIKSTSQNEAGSAILDAEAVRAAVEALGKIAQNKDIDRIVEILHSEKSKEPYLVHEKPK